MTKQSAKALARLQAKSEPGRPTLDDDGTPVCIACGEHNIKLGADALLMLQGQWLPYRAHDVAAFVVDADTKLHIEELPNGQYVIITDVQGHPTKHAHTDCIRDLVNDSVNYDIEDEEDEDEDEDEEDFDFDFDFEERHR